MKEINKLKQELLIMKTNNIKPNYSELARLHSCDRRTIKKYDNLYEGKPTTRNKESKLDKYKKEIKSKLELPGSTIKGTYEFFKELWSSMFRGSNYNSLMYNFLIICKYTTSCRCKCSSSNSSMDLYRRTSIQYAGFSWNN